MVADAELVYLTSDSGLLQVVDVQDGKLQWQTEFPGWVYPPTFGTNQLYTGGSEGTLWALDQTNGGLLWERKLGQEMVFSPVVVQGGIVVVTTFAKEVLAFSPTGVRLWKTQLPAVVSSPVVQDGRLIFSGLDHQLYGIDERTGELAWSSPLQARLRIPMVVSQGEVIAILDDGRLVSIDAHTGRVEELYRVRGEPIAPPYPGGDRITVFLRSLNGPEVININRHIGEKSTEEI